jgi:hypothetical protein
MRRDSSAELFLLLHIALNSAAHCTKNRTHGHNSAAYWSHWNTHRLISTTLADQMNQRIHFSSAMKKSAIRRVGSWRRKCSPEAVQSAEWTYIFTFSIQKLSRCIVVPLKLSSSNTSHITVLWTSTFQLAISSACLGYFRMLTAANCEAHFLRQSCNFSIVRY